MISDNDTQGQPTGSVRTAQAVGGEDFVAPVGVNKDADEAPKKRGRGRPRKGEIVEKKKRGKVGRPKGDAGIINDYKARMLASPKSESVLYKVLNTALEDGHPHQAACMKMVMDRILPASYFEKDKLSKGSSGIEININLGGDTDVKDIDGDAVIVEDD